MDNFECNPLTLIQQSKAKTILVYCNIDYSKTMFPEYSLEELATQDLIAARQAANDPNVPVEERERLVAQAQQSYLAYTQARAAAQQQGVVLDPDTGTLQTTRPGGAAPQLPAMPSAPAGSGGNNQTKGSATGQTKSGNSYRIEKQ